MNTLPSQLPWTAEIDGRDLVVRNVTVTCFGGGHDAGDDGQTESGVMNDGSNPGLMGCALPIRSTEAATRISPLAFKGPHLPWGTKVRFWRDADGEDSAVELELIDNGPNDLVCPTHAGDVTVAAAHGWAPEIPIEKLANDWEGSGFSYRIIDGARWVS